MAPSSLFTQSDSSAEWSFCEDTVRSPKPEPSSSDAGSDCSSLTLSIPERESLIVRLPVHSLPSENQQVQPDTAFAASPQNMSVDLIATSIDGQQPRAAGATSIATYGALGSPSIGTMLGQGGGMLTAREKAIKLLELKFEKYQHKEKRLVRQLENLRSARSDDKDLDDAEDKLSLLHEKMTDIQKEWLELQPVAEEDEDDEEDGDYEGGDEDDHGEHEDESELSEDWKLEEGEGEYEVVTQHPYIDGWGG